MADYDVVVVGAGNAALAAAVSAREQGAASVVALEKAPRELRGGNTHYSGGLLDSPTIGPRRSGRWCPTPSTTCRASWPESSPIQPPASTPTWRG
jgi:tricarballylate dehydrogenase